MWSNERNFPLRGFSTPPPTWKSRPHHSPVMPMSERKRISPVNKNDLFHVIHKVPAGDSPYVRAKQVQLVEKDPCRAISLFWAAINEGDRVDSALKDMAVVMKQLNRSEEAIEAIKSFRHLCPFDSQESLDNVLIELYKRSGRVEEEIEMLQHKLKTIEEGTAFGGKRTKIARSQGKKIHITVEQERSRILGNLAWAYLQQHNYGIAEQHYRKALFLEPDNNKQCNLAVCLMHMNRIPEAKALLQAVKASSGNRQMDESYAKSYERAFQVLTEIESQSVLEPIAREYDNGKAIQRSCTFPRSLNKVTSSFDRGCNYISGITDSRRRADGCDEETVLLNAQSRGSYCQTNAEKDNFFGYDKGSLDCMSFRLKGNSQSPPQTTSVNNWRNSSYLETPYERPGFASKMTENWASTTGLEVSSAHKNTFASPSPVGRNTEVLFTQPRRCSWGFNNNGDLKKGKWREDVAGSSNRKLLFDENIILENGGQRKSAMEDCNSSPPTVADNARGLGKVGEQNQSSDIDVAGWMKSIITIQDKWFGMNCFDESESLHQPRAEKPKLSQDGPGNKSKMSWADMVEEDEQELSSGRNPSKCFDGWSTEEEFNDENLNSNIIYQNSCSNNQVEILSRNLRSFDLKDGYYTSEVAISSRNPTVCRSLCFNQPQKPEPTENSSCSSSPLPKKGLNFEGYNNSVAEKESDSISGKKINMKRRNRLQVFRDITLPESPRA